jgi:hypothetical protein
MMKVPPIELLIGWSVSGRGYNTLKINLLTGVIIHLKTNLIDTYYKQINTYDTI